MRFVKIILYILTIPFFLYLALFFNYLSLFSLFLIFSVFIFRDLKSFGLIWMLVLISIFLDVVLNLWLGTHLLVVTLSLLVLSLFDRFVSNLFLDIVAVFFSFLFFIFLFNTFTFFQETSALPSFDLEFFSNVVFFTMKNIFAYLFLKIVEYFLKSYFTQEVF